MAHKKIVIIGGVAAGASAATRARRLSEAAEIIILERGHYVSFANCGLPYYVGGEIAERSKLTVQTPKSLADRFKLDVRIRNEVVEILPATQQVRIRRLESGEEYKETYDELVLATGASPLRPPIPGIESKRLFTVRDIPDVENIKIAMAEREWGTVAILGGGYIGLEMAEQLHLHGAEVTIIEALPQVMAPLDPEMAELLHSELRKKGIRLLLNDPVAAFEEGADKHGLVVRTRSGRAERFDAGILGLGIRPDTTLAAKADVAIGDRGGIRVDGQLRTNVPHIWAAGDAVEVKDLVLGTSSLFPLAGPANRQGRMIADNIFGAGREYHGTQGTAILRIFSLVAGCTGANEKSLRRAHMPYKVIHLHPGSHAGYFPGAKPIALKVIFAPNDGRLLGAQAVGEDGVDKRIDVFATAIRARLSVRDLADLELAYAPPFGSAKDPVNLAGMIAENVLDQKVDCTGWNEISGDSFLLDVREPSEVEKGTIPGAVNIPLNRLREELLRLPKEREIVVFCHTGQRSYYACRILMQNGYRCRNLSGAWKTWSSAQPRQETPAHR